MYLQLYMYLIQPIHNNAYFSDVVMGTPFIWVSISKYVDNGTAKVPISAKIGVRVQGSTSEIWNLPFTLLFLLGDIFNAFNYIY